MQKRKYEHITATLRDDVHWLPICQRSEQAVYHCLQVSTRGSSAPSYLTEICVPVAASTGCRCLRSAARGDLMVPRTRTITYITELCSLRTTCLESATGYAFIIHHIRTVPEQTKDNTISLGLRDVTWRFRDCLGR